MVKMNEFKTTMKHIVSRMTHRCLKHSKQINDQLKSQSETRLLCVGLKLAPALFVFSAETLSSLRVPDHVASDSNWAIVIHLSTAQVTCPLS